MRSKQFCTSHLLQKDKADLRLNISIDRNQGRSDLRTDFFQHVLLSWFLNWNSSELCYRCDLLKINAENTDMSTKINTIKSHTPKFKTKTWYNYERMQLMFSLLLYTNNIVFSQTFAVTMSHQFYMLMT